MDKKHKQFWESLNDSEFRKDIIDEHVDEGISFQIRSIRNRQELTQMDLAELMGDKKKQPTISDWENPDYGKYTLNTLKELAKAFDVGLLVRFVPFSTLIDWTIDITPEKIAPPNFKEEYEGILMTDSVELFLKREIGQSTGDSDSCSLSGNQKNREYSPISAAGLD